MASILDNLTNAEAMKFIDQVNEPFKTLPHLPKNVIDIFATITPWLILLGILAEVFAILGSVVLLALSPVFGIISLVVSVITGLLMLMAFTPLKNRETKGWVLLFWIQVFGIVGSVAGSLNGNFSSVIGSLIGFAIGLYILFEMRPAYGIAKSVAKKTEEVVK